MEKYPELIRNPDCAEQFFNEFKGVLPEDSFLAGFNFAVSCDKFHWAFNKYLLSEEEITLYRSTKHIRAFFEENEAHARRLVLYAIFVKDYLQLTEALLLDREYYELMTKFADAKTKIDHLVRILLADNESHKELLKAESC